MLTWLLRIRGIDYLFYLNLLTSSLSFLNYLLNFRISFFFLNYGSFSENWLKYLLLLNNFRLCLFWCLIKNVIHYFWFLLLLWFLFALVFEWILYSDMFQSSLRLLLNICKLSLIIFFLIFIHQFFLLLKALLLIILFWIFFFKVTLNLHSIRNNNLNFINSLLRIKLDFTGW